MSSGNRAPEPPWRRYLRFWGSRPASDIDDELAFHIESRVDDYVALGMQRDAARARALERFGHPERYRDETLGIDRQEQRRRTVSDFFVSVRDDLRLAAAFSLCSRGELSTSLAARLAGMTYADFLEAAARAKIELFPVNLQELSEEIQRGFTLGRECVADYPAGPSRPS